MKDYSDRVARHYEAYRPPLHERILRAAIPAGSRFEVGLDVGCGTGVSTRALKEYCDTVYGVDPSQEMLARAGTGNGLVYRRGRLENLTGISAQIVTFAGSLYYAQDRHLERGLCAVCADSALVIVYDFEVHLEQWESRIGIEGLRTGGYDHTVNLSGCSTLNELFVEQESVECEMSAWQLAQVMLSSEERYLRLEEKYGSSEDLEDAVVAELQKMSDRHLAPATLHRSGYRVIQNCPLPSQT